MLITLVISGVIAAITVPNIIQSSQDKEFHSALKKNISVIENAFNLAQIDEGLMGDNTAIFVPSGAQDSHYKTAKRLANYLNVIKVCKSKDDDGCSDVYYNVKFSSKQFHNGYTSFNFARIVLADGAIYDVEQKDRCDGYYTSCVTDQYGNCKKDENGNNIPTTIHQPECGYIRIDVNGTKGPNKFGKDIFWLNIYKDNIGLNLGYPFGGTASKDIITGKI